jgi:hypothetical protein
MPNDWKFSVVMVLLFGIACAVFWLMLSSCLRDTGWSILTCLWVSGG